MIYLKLKNFSCKEKKLGNISNRSCSVHLVYLSPLQSNSVYFFHFGPSSSTSVHSSPIQSTLVYSVHLVHICPIQSIWSNLIHSIHFGLFALIRSISIHFGLIRCTYIRMKKRQVLVESTINYLSNINCNYRISFGYYNNLLKRMNNFKS